MDDKLEIKDARYMKKFQNISNKTSKPIEWHLLRAIRRYCILYKELPPEERLFEDRSNCTAKCTIIPGSVDCLSCSRYQYNPKNIKEE